MLERIQAGDARIRWIRNPSGIVSTGLNSAIRQARSQIIVRMDVHTVYAKDYLRNCVRVLRERNCMNVGGAWRARGQGLMGEAIAAAFQSRFGAGGASSRNVQHEGDVETVYLGCWWKKDLEELGLFDETLVRNQDDELNLRIVRSGGRIWQSPAIVSWYTPRSNLRNLFQQYFQYGYWKVPVIRKHKMPASWRHLVPGSFALALLGLPLLGLGCRFLWGSEPAKNVLTLWLAMLAAYAALAMMASVSSARKHGWKLLPVLPAVFATYHVSYGLGFLAGLARWPLWKRGENPGGWAAQLTR
jgi:hypothetical protein